MASKNDLSELLAAAVQKTAPGVLRVEARSRTPSSGLVWSAEGMAVTAHHALQRDEQIQVGLPDGQLVPATLIGRDPTTDVAVLRVDASGLAQPQWSDAPELKVGHLVLAVARPGRTARATLGIVSALAEEWRTPAGGRVDRYLQTDLSLPPGFSGSALVDAQGSVLGMNTSWLLPRHALAIPASTLRKVVDTLVAEGRIRRGFLGIGAFPINLPEKLSQQAGQSTGLMIISLQPEGPADKAGLMLGDVLLAFGGQSLASVEELTEQLDGEKIGSEASVKLFRAGQIQQQQVTVGSRP
jgi:S1-C subfamily serine protease